MKHRNPLRWYQVLSPVYTYTDVIDMFIGGPSYDERDWLAVEAYTKREAKIIAVRHWLKICAAYLDGSENPFAGVEATEMETPEAEDINDVKMGFLRYSEAQP